MDKLQIIDAHHHLWDLSSKRYPWLIRKDPREAPLLGNYTPIKKDYLINDYLIDAKNQQIKKSVHIQAGRTGDPVNETKWLQEIADKSGFPHAIIAYADLSDNKIETVLAKHCQFANMRGIRQILRWHEKPDLQGTSKDYLINTDWQKGFAFLQKYNLLFDMLIYPHQMPIAFDLVKKHENIPVVIEHTGLPIDIYDNSFAFWRKQLLLLAQLPNITIKISGLGMLIHNWTIANIKPYVETAIEIFGVDRCMFASNFPVDKLYSSCDRLFDAYKMIVNQMSTQEQKAVFYDNAAKFYRI